MDHETSGVSCSSNWDFFFSKNGICCMNTKAGGCGEKSPHLNFLHTQWFGSSDLGNCDITYVIGHYWTIPETLFHFYQFNVVQPNDNDTTQSQFKIEIQ